MVRTTAPEGGQVGGLPRLFDEAGGRRTSARWDGRGRREGDLQRLEAGSTAQTTKAVRPEARSSSRVDPLEFGLGHRELGFDGLALASLGPTNRRPSGGPDGRRSGDT
jgi:hypothetical protein